MAAKEECLFLNEAFYQAFRDCDINAMASLWVADSPAVCIHPGTSAIFGREIILESWRQIFSNAQNPRITCHGARAEMMGDVCLVTCHEDLPGGPLMASNLFVREDGRWRMALHQAGPCQMPAERFAQAAKAQSLQ